jgi:hypothetical protein
MASLSSSEISTQLVRRLYLRPFILTRSPSSVFSPDSWYIGGFLVKNTEKIPTSSSQKNFLDHLHIGELTSKIFFFLEFVVFEYFLSFSERRISSCCFVLPSCSFCNQKEPKVSGWQLDVGNHFLDLLFFSHCHPEPHSFVVQQKM